MKANPGGYISPENVFGRDKLIQDIWERLEQQCVVINAERRIGKTSVIKKVLLDLIKSERLILQQVLGLQ